MILLTVSSIFAEQKLGGKIDLLQIIINPFAYVAGDEDTKLTDSISNSLEPICRQLILKKKIINDLSEPCVPQDQD
jgi:hypothetical protein